MNKNRIWIVTAYYTEYKHNHCTEHEVIKVFTTLNRAMEYVKGTDGNGTLLPYEKRLPLSLKEGVSAPKFNIACSGHADIAFKTDLSCLNEYDINHGGFIYKVEITEDTIY